MTMAQMNANETALLTSGYLREPSYDLWRGVKGYFRSGEVRFHYQNRVMTPLQLRRFSASLVRLENSGSLPLTEDIWERLMSQHPLNRLSCHTWLQLPFGWLHPQSERVVSLSQADPDQYQLKQGDRLVGEYGTIDAAIDFAQRKGLNIWSNRDYAWVHTRRPLRPAEIRVNDLVSTTTAQEAYYSLYAAGNPEVWFIPGQTGVVGAIEVPAVSGKEKNFVCVDFEVLGQHWRCALDYEQVVWLHRS